jgi:hypothetical protein
MTRYYLGGIQHAEKTALRVIDEKYNELFEHILILLSASTQKSSKELIHSGAKLNRADD